MDDDKHLKRFVRCDNCDWSGVNGELIAKHKLVCPRCDSDQILYLVLPPPKNSAVEERPLKFAYADPDRIGAKAMFEWLATWRGFYITAILIAVYFVVLFAYIASR